MIALTKTTATKASKSAAGYQGPELGPFHCGGCIFFGEPEQGPVGDCLLVDGEEDGIHTYGCCNLYTSEHTGEISEEVLTLWKQIHELTEEYLVKAKVIRIDPAVLHPKSEAAKGHLHMTLHHVFEKQRSIAVHHARKLYKVPNKSFLYKRTAEEIAQAIYEALLEQFLELPDATETALEDAALEGVNAGFAQLGIDDEGLISSVNAIARDWARSRAAAMVGMRRNDEGELVANPRAEWAITETTRDELRSIISSAFEQETPMGTLIEAIQEAGSFSDARAEMIARTEVSFAQTSGNYSVWRESGVVERVRWMMSEDHEIEDDCDDNDDEIVNIGEPFPSGHFMPPAHPNCWCVVVAVMGEEGEE